MTDLIWSLQTSLTALPPRAYTDRPYLTPLTPKSGLKTILMPSVIKGDYQNNRQWAKSVC